MLESVEPDVIIVMVGATDFVTAPVGVESDEVRWGLRRFFRQHSRAYRLFYMILRFRELPGVEIVHDANPLPELGGAESKLRYGRREFTMGWRKQIQPQQRVLMALKRNLESVVQYSREFGASLFLMTYPSRRPPYPYRVANPIIRTVAEETNTPLIDLAAEFSGLCADLDCAEFLFRDQHPNPEGYRVIAETIARRLSRLYGPE
jgi:lysophospholipase L1-like esterase